MKPKKQPNFLENSQISLKNQPIFFALKTNLQRHLVMKVCIFQELAKFIEKLAKFIENQPNILKNQPNIFPGVPNLAKFFFPARQEQPNFVYWLAKNRQIFYRPAQSSQSFSPACKNSQVFLPVCKDSQTFYRRAKNSQISLPTRQKQPNF